MRHETASDTPTASPLGGRDRRAAAVRRRVTFEAEALPHLETVRSVALRLVGDPARADDLVQDTLLKAYRAWDRFERGTNVRGWLVTILRRTHYSAYRDRRRRGRMLRLPVVREMSGSMEAGTPDPETEMLDRAVDPRLLRAIAELTPPFRTVLVMSDIDGLDYAEIARRLRVPLGTVKSRLSRARRSIRNRIYSHALAMGYIHQSGSRTSSRTAASG